MSWSTHWSLLAMISGAAGSTALSASRTVHAAPSVTASMVTISQPGAISRSARTKPYSASCSARHTNTKRVGSCAVRLRTTTSIIGTPWIGSRGLGVS